MYRVYEIVRVLVVYLIISLLISVSIFAQYTQKPIKIGMDEDYPPFSFFDKAVPTGFDVDIIEELNRYSPQKVEVVLDSWAQVLIALDNGDIDAIGGILYTEERAKRYDFTKPYNFEPAVIFVSKKAKITSMQDLYDKKMTALKDDFFAENIIRDSGIKVIVATCDTSTGVFSNLETGQADFTIAPYSLGMEIIHKQGYKNVVSMGPNISTYQYRIAVRKGDAEVLNALNMAIEKIQETNFKEKNKQKWIKYKNDGITWIEILTFILYVFIPVIILILILAVYILKREIARKTMLLQAQNEELTKLAMLDPGTELYNRRKFYELAKQEFAGSKQSGKSFGLLMIDLDWFKKINDAYGHDVGDLVITHFAQMCKKYFRKDDVVCRFGGEEFIVLLPMSEEAEVITIAEGMRRLINEDEIIFDEGNSVKYTISIGIAMFKDSDEKIQEIIKRADNALYKAKDAGRNQVSITR